MAIDIQTKRVIQDESVRNVMTAKNTDVRKADDASAERARQAEKLREENRTRHEENRKAILEEQAKAATLDETKGKIISESKDGDTVRASEKSMAAIKDGMVLSKGSDEDQSKIAAQEAADKEKQQNTGNLGEYSASQIEALYREGKISRQDYDKEIERREEIKEAAQTDTYKEDESKKVTAKEDVAKKTTANVTEEKRTAAKTIKEDNDKKAEASKERQAQATKSAERAKTIEAENETFTNFESKMNDLIGQQMRVNQDPDLERFGTVEGFNISISQ